MISAINLFVSTLSTLTFSLGAETQKHICCQTKHHLLTLNDHSGSLFKCCIPSAAKQESARGEERLCEHLDRKKADGYEQVYGPHAFLNGVGLLWVDRFHVVSGSAGALT